MSKGARIALGIGIAIAVLLVLLYTSRAVWVAAIKAKWGKRITGMFEWTADQWRGMTMAELRKMYLHGQATWFEAGTPEHIAASKANPPRRRDGSSDTAEDWKA